MALSVPTKTAWMKSRLPSSSAVHAFSIVKVTVVLVWDPIRIGIEEYMNGPSCSTEVPCS